MEGSISQIIDTHNSGNQDHISYQVEALKQIFL
jgi:hypothetical protein